MIEYKIQQRHDERNGGEWVDSRETKYSKRAKTYYSYDKVLEGLEKVKALWEEYEKRDTDIPAYNEFRIVWREVSSWKEV